MLSPILQDTSKFCPTNHLLKQYIPCPLRVLPLTADENGPFPADVVPAMRIEYSVSFCSPVISYDDHEG